MGEMTPLGGEGSGQTAGLLPNQLSGEMPKKERAFAGQERVRFLRLDRWTPSVRLQWYPPAAAPPSTHPAAYFHSSLVGPSLTPLRAWENTDKMKAVPAHQGKSSLSQHHEVPRHKSTELGTG